MTPQQNDLIPVAGRPAFLARMVAVWRIHHACRGDSLTATIYPGEWPDPLPAQIADGVDVVADAKVGGAGGVLILGRTPEAEWKGVYNIALAAFGDFHISNLIRVSVFLQIPAGQRPTTANVKVWMTPRRDGHRPAATGADLLAGRPFGYRLR